MSESFSVIESLSPADDFLKKDDLVRSVGLHDPADDQLQFLPG
jgi:hypothetical protein